MKVRAASKACLILPLLPISIQIVAAEYPDANTTEVDANEKLDLYDASLRGSDDSEDLGRRRRLARYGEGCNKGIQCLDGLTCQPGHNTCYSSPRQLYEPCSAGHECADGLSCQGSVQRCMHNERLPYESCDSISDGPFDACSEGTYCGNINDNIDIAEASLESICQHSKLLNAFGEVGQVSACRKNLLLSFVSQISMVCIPKAGILTKTVSGGVDDGLQVQCDSFGECRSKTGCTEFVNQNDCEDYSGCAWWGGSCGAENEYTTDSTITFMDTKTCNQEGALYSFKVSQTQGYEYLRELDLLNPTIRDSDSILPPRHNTNSLRFSGPIKKGTWVQISDKKDQFANANTINIVINRDIASGDYACVHIPEPTTVGSDGKGVEKEDYRWRFTTAGKSSDAFFSNRFLIRTPSHDGFDVNALRNLQWTPKFGGENGGYSPNWVAPVVGISNSDKWGSDKWLLQARGSSCRAGGQQVTHWTTWITSSDGAENELECPAGHVMGRMQCDGGYCQRVRLGCFPITSKCVISYSTSDFRAVQVPQNQEGFCPHGHFVTGLKCLQAKCKNHEIICRSITAAKANVAALER